MIEAEHNDARKAGATMIDFVTRDNLNTVMEFDHVIQVHAYGTVTDADSIWAPEVSISGETEISGPRAPHISSSPRRIWTLMDGYSGQYLYHGPVMHASEYIGGRMADDILATPGYYVAVTVRDDDADTDNGDDDIAGWAVARLVR